VIVGSDWSGAAVTLGVLALIGLAGYFVVLAALTVSTRPRRPTPGPATQNIPSDETPAVAGFLANTWKVPRAAIPATLIDLAARRIVSIEEVSPDDFNVRLRSQQSPAPELTPYEQRVYDHVRGLADSHGVVPCRALTTGPQDQSSAWWQAFRKEVVSDAKGRGLSRNRWRGWELSVLATAAAVPAVLAFIALSIAYDTNAPHSSSSSDSGPEWIAVFAWFVLLAVPLMFRSQRETARGSEVASRWLGLQTYLRDDAEFADYPVASVAIWQRYLSYGAALGVARAAVAALPMGSESVHEAWSKESGRWRLVHIEYPKWPPGYGNVPTRLVVSAVFTGLLAGAGLIGSLYGLARLIAAGTQTDKATNEFRTTGLWFLAIVVALAIFWLVASLVWLSYALPDVKARVQKRGRLLRLREEHNDDGVETWVAVDDGTAVSEVRAYRLPGGARNELVQGCLVDITVSPKLGHVFSITRVAEPGSSVPARRVSPQPTQSLRQRLLDPDHDTSAAASTPAKTTDLDLTKIAAATGVTLSVETHQREAGYEVWSLADGARGHVLVRRGPDVAASASTGCLFGARTMSRVARRRRNSIPGVGEWAAWSEKRSTLVAYGAGHYVSASALLEGAPSDVRQRVAIGLVQQLV
jgi:F0F1-type ATP synthase membrane subunit c/vacuolar-type H+-ATPase subunit K